MSGKKVISLEGVSKIYRIWDDPQDRIKTPFYRSVSGLFPKFTGMHKRLVKKANSYYKEFPALKDINLEVFQGESIGVVGKNGSGKSTLLQLIAGTLQPTEGRVDVCGKLSALLELGAGFNPEFTGRENVYLNASIMGFVKSEIDDMFDEIASFADIGEHLDQPTKTYSSGMLVRLAFAVQAQVEPDILIVDEALAVGDSLFRKRCMKRLDNLINSGVTLLFVSHAEEMVRTLTKRAILLRDGRIRVNGPSPEVILEYRKSQHQDEESYLEQAAKKAVKANIEKREVKVSDKGLGDRAVTMAFGDKDVVIENVLMLDEHFEEKIIFEPNEKFILRLNVKVNETIQHLNIGIRIRNNEGVKMYSWGTLNQDMILKDEGAEELMFWNRTHQSGDRLEVDFSGEIGFGANFYEIQAYITEEQKPYYVDQRIVHWWEEAAFFQVKMNPRGYFYGGVSDLKISATIR